MTRICRRQPIDPASPPDVINIGVGDPGVIPSGPGGQVSRQDGFAGNPWNVLTETR